MSEYCYNPEHGPLATLRSKCRGCQSALARLEKREANRIAESHGIETRKAARHWRCKDRAYFAWRSEVSRLSGECGAFGPTPEAATLALADKLGLK